jgi:hypothetical protein
MLTIHTIKGLSWSRNRRNSSGVRRLKMRIKGAMSCRGMINREMPNRATSCRVMSSRGMINRLVINKATSCRATSSRVTSVVAEVRLQTLET